MAWARVRRPVSTAAAPPDAGTGGRDSAARRWPARVGLSAPAGTGLYLLLMLAPLALAVPLQERPVVDEVATSFGLVAFAVALLEFALSGRFRRVSGRIGVERTLRVHRVVAYGMVALIALHPFLYTHAQVERRWATAPWFTGTAPELGLAPLPLWTGTAALVLVVALVVTAIDRRALPCRYETWRRLHAGGALLATALVAVHAFTAGGYSADLPLAGYWALLLTAAGTSLVHGYAVAPWRQRRRPFRVQSVDRVARHTWEVRLRPDTAAGGAPLAFRPGQFVWLKLGDGAFRSQEHPFSISTAPEQGPTLGFTIKEKGDFTDRIGRCVPGTRAYLDGPHGHFVPDETPVPTVYVAAGTGVGPVLSHLRAFRARGDRRPLVLLYAAATPDDLASRAELDAMAGELDLTLHYVVRDPPPGWSGHAGPIDQALLNACLPAEGRRRARYFVCGSEAMMRDVARALRALGVPGRRIVTGS